MARHGTTIQSLRERIDKLSNEQADALSKSVYVSMSNEQNREYNERAEQLTELRGELLDLMRAEKA